MINGKAHVDLDEILADIIVVDENNPIRTFFTPQDMLYFNGAAVVNQTKTGFDIVELNGGSHSGKIHDDRKKQIDEEKFNIKLLSNQKQVLVKVVLLKLLGHRI